MCSCGNRECSSPGKHPRVARGSTEATRDERILHDWWGRWPDANVAIATGAGSNLVALDIDPRHGGDESIDRLEDAHGKLPDTVEAITGGGGRHVLFSNPGTPVPCSAGKLGPGLDVRGEGGFIVAPPSIHVSGASYEWEGSSRPDARRPEPLPNWLRGAAVIRAQSGAMNGNLRAMITRGVSEGGRNNALARVAGLLIGSMLSPPMALDLLHAWNVARCRPPLGDAEVIKTFSSISARDGRRRKA